ncbi:DUF805 domain-containing protein [Lichenihabitans psoromatis]|uniref:DUF805 domain-containing protein n=1 Tax=Lichenihabitans psoromatis TaxID=2528642 RepID=UPI001FE1DA68|nr:DUF805 domain-containing protein [Lichenihabitans psoromatis]
MLVAAVISGVARYAQTALHLSIPVAELVMLVHIIPSTTVQIRRLRDTGRSGYWLWLGLTVVGIVPLLVWSCQKSVSPGDGYNEFDRLFPLRRDVTPSAAGGYPSAKIAQSKSAGTRLGIGAVLFVVLSGTVGVALMADEDGYRMMDLLGGASLCSSASVTTLVTKVLRDSFRQDPTFAGIVDADKTDVVLTAIRTMSSSTTTSECAANATYKYWLKTGNGTAEAKQFDSTFNKPGGIDISYQAQKTDDGQKVHVSVRIE